MQDSRFNYYAAIQTSIYWLNTIREMDDFEIDGIKYRVENEQKSQLPLTLWQDLIFYVWDFIKYPAIWQFVIICGQLEWTEEFRPC